MVQLSDQFGGPRMTKGGQGKLFSDPKPIDQHRYQRGYTPERMNEVRQMPLDISIAPKRSQATSDPQRIRLAHEMIARTTVPSGDLPSNKKTPVRFNMRLSGAAGQYDPNTGVVKVERGLPTNKVFEGKGNQARQQRREAVAKQRHEMGQTVTHELGHLYSHDVARNEWPRGDHFLAGKEEGRADEYKIQHYRPDPRDVRKGRITGKLDMPYEDVGRRRDVFFKAGYSAGRTTPFQPRQRPRYGPEPEQQSFGV